MPEPDASSLVQIGELAGRLGVTHRTLRFYEERKLLSSAIIGNTRHYDQRQAQRAAEIVKYRALGFTVEEIRPLLPGGDTVADAALKAAIRKQIKELERRLDEVKLALDELRLIPVTPGATSGLQVEVAVQPDASANREYSRSFIGGSA